jgi:DNA adenine methylase
MNKSYNQIIVRYNKPHVFLYLDSPYYGKEEVYEKVFNQENHEELAVLLGGFKGSFMLSYNDCKEVRELYKGFKIEEITCNYFAMGKKNGTVGRKLIINNY